MKVTLEEKIKKKLVKFGRKNRLCRWMAIPGLALVVIVFRFCSFLCKNSKRLSVLVLIVCMFSVYGSFSFSVFGQEQSSVGAWDIDSNVELAPVSGVDMEQVGILTDEDVLSEFEKKKEGNDLDAWDKYEADELLAGWQQDQTMELQRQDEGEEHSFEEYGFDKGDWKLILINKQHSIPKDYTFELGTIAGTMQCDARVKDELFLMLQTAKEEGVSLSVCSPYRSPERQIMLFERKIKRYMDRGMSYLEAYQLASQAVTIPGNSEHEVGLAFDIISDSYTSLDEGFGSTVAGKWLAENSSRFGFILRYPKGKEFTTGIEYEPWHFRYVGVDAATYITQNHITLEEFWEELAE